MKKVFRTLLIKIPLFLMAVGLFFVLMYKFLPVFITPLMIVRAFQYGEQYQIRKEWVSIEEISPNVIKAVIASEDNLFPQHKGFEFDEIRKMYNEHKEKGKKIRGCSTISQQTAKNTFTWCTHTWVRKVVEAYYTVLIELVWGKERIMEVYLNVAEWGCGIYGVQAASEYYFGCDASDLGRNQAALLAASLPNPIKRNPARPGKFVQGRARAVQSLMGKLEYPDWVDHK